MYIINIGVCTTSATSTYAQYVENCVCLQVNPRLPRLSAMKVADVCRMITDIDGMTGTALPRYLDIVRENNINGIVLLQYVFSPFAAVSLFGVAGLAETFPSFSVSGRLHPDGPGFQVPSDSVIPPRRLQLLGCFLFHLFF